MAAAESASRLARPKSLLVRSTGCTHDTLDTTRRYAAVNSQALKGLNRKQSSIVGSNNDTTDNDDNAL